MSQENPISRRELLRAATAGAVAAGASAVLQPMNVFAKSKQAKALPTRPLGLTGVSVFPFGLGGQGLLEIPGHDDEAVAIINRAIDLGMNYLDTAWWYGNGSSETYYGEALGARRNSIYLATKSDQRTYDGAMRQLDESLKRLKTDHLNCWQMHNVRTSQDVEKIFAPDGALKAFQKARDEKITRFIGITGHRNPFVLKDAIGRFNFDTILMALNAADVHLNGADNETSFIKNLLPAAVEKKLGIIGMKVPALGNIFKPDGIATMDQAMGYVLSLPVSALIVGVKTIPQLEENVRIARDFKPFTPAEMAKLEDLTKPYFEDATFFKRQRGY
jgi:aryl-alcohol dehydrogenase-like predicted oxidoreductase